MSQTLDTRGTNDPRVYRDSALTNVAVGITSATNLSGWNIINTNSSDVYVKFYDVSSGSVTVGTTTAVKTIAVPANTTVYLAHNAAQTQYYFSTAMSFACVTGIADTSTTAPATAIYIEIFFNP